MKDTDGDEVKAGDTIEFSYGIPPVHVVAEVVESSSGELIALTPGHHPAKCKLSRLESYVGQFWRKNK